MEKQRKQEIKEALKKNSTNEIRNLLKTSRETIYYAEKEFDKRKDKKLSEIIIEELWWIIWSGIIILFFSLFYFGALPNYFGVNDEFINPTTNFTGFNYAFNLVQNATTTHLFMKFHDIGASSPTFWFWFWWFLVFMIFIYPIIKVIWFVIRRHNEKR